MLGSEEQMNNLVNELLKGRELARLLQVHLNKMPSSSSSSSLSPSSHETHVIFFVQNILASYDKALSLINTPPRLIKQVRVGPGFGLEDSLDDGFNWRKLAQKHILGSKFPRGYYKCIGRNVEGCLATKQVQRSDEDPSIFQVVYSGIHTCSQASSNSNFVIPSTSDINYNDRDPQQNINSQLVDTKQLQILESFHSSFNFAPTTSSTDKTELKDGLLGCMIDDHNNLSPANNYFTMSQDHVRTSSGLDLDQMNQNLHNNYSDSDLIHDFPFGQVSDFEPNFNFGSPPFFP